MNLLAVGSLAFDDLQTPAGTRDNLLGGSVTYFSLSASRFNPVQVVAVVGEDFGPDHQRVFEGRPIDLGGLIRKPGRCFRWRGRYGNDLNTATTLDTQLNVFADFRPQLMDAFKETPYLFLGNIDPVLQLDVVKQMARRPRWIALDTMNFWIEGSRDALHAVLKEVDILLVNEAETQALTGERNLLKAFKKVRSFGPRILVVKRGEYGVLLLTPEGAFPAPAVPLEDVIDPTGAGDTFAGGFLGFLASKGLDDLGSLKQAVLAGVVMASFAVERFGIENLANVSDADIKERMKAFSSTIRTDGL
jgi:sugar/nucleoside kinase (ribokinase family)